MPKIKRLPEDIARKIAAGEVVERPASVVKELVENALDAGATTITIKISGAGSGMIEVGDNGYGMSPDDLELAPLSFSTSKILRPEDLFSISTYGFRGEALSSICAVSRLEITSSSRGDGEGWRISLEGERFVEKAPAPHRRGTTVRVCDLFFNTPARRKFLKSDAAERRRIFETVLSFAMIREEVEMHFVDEGRHVLDLLPTESWRGRLEEILGGSSMKHMVSIGEETPNVRLSGFTSLPTFTRGSRGYQFLYVNRRLVKEKTIIHAINQAYKNLIPSNRFPVIVLSLDVPFENVDVNVHPSKLEVRIRDEKAIHETVSKALKEALSPHREGEIEVSYVPGQAGGPREGALLASNPVDELLGSSCVREVEENGEKAGPAQARIQDAYATFMRKLRDTAAFPLNPQLSLRAEEEELPGGSAERWAEGALGEEGLFWQFNRSFIFIQVHGGLVIIDQHAAHERIIYDSSKRKLEKEIPISQQILFPIHLELSLNELEIFHSSQDIFKKLGFDLDPFGGKSILVRGYPQGLKNWGEGHLLLQVFDDVLQDRAPGDSHTEKVLASFACRSAVRAGQKLSVREMSLLADQLFAVENPYSCPHGRPTIQRISLEQMERWFLRR